MPRMGSVPILTNFQPAPGPRSEAILPRFVWLLRAQAENFSAPPEPLMAGEAVPCGATDAPRRVPALIATGTRDERGALVPVVK